MDDPMQTTEPDTELIERLAQHRIIGAAPPEELAWLASHGKLHQFDTGAVVSARDAGRPEGMFIVLSGHFAISVDRGTGRHKVIEWFAGDIAGYLPYSRLNAPPGDAVTEAPTEVLTIHSSDFPEMIATCHEVTAMVVHVMLDRARSFTSGALHDEKMLSLGKLAAGLAHELNNPASAVARSAKMLTTNLAAAEMAARMLGASRLNDEQLAALDSIRECCLSTSRGGVRSPIQQAEREDEIADWLDDHGADSSIAESLAETSVTIGALDKLAQSIEGSALDAALRWVATGCTVRALAQEIEQAAFRIHTLVTAVKGFTYMDQSTTSQPCSVGDGLRNTLAVLRSKAQSKSLAVDIRVDDDLPEVDGFGGELNQVWMNLIDNAIDASPESGHVEVTATREGDEVIIHVVDNGPGIPQEVRDRIFDPFFTTKPVGQGTGLGLDISRRLVQRHNGQIELTSQPGRTEFRVLLPVARTTTNVQS
jgi:signal transduction histidine kinase